MTKPIAAVQESEYGTKRTIRSHPRLSAIGPKTLVWGTETSVTKTHGGGRECLVNGLLNAVEYHAANDRDNDRSNARQ